MLPLESTAEGKSLLDYVISIVSSVPEVTPIKAEGIGEGDTGDVGEALPRVLDSVEEDEKQQKEEEDSWDAHANQDNLDDFEDVNFLLFLFLCLVHNPAEILIGDDDATQEEPKHEASDVSNVVNKREQANRQQSQDNNA